MEIVFILVKSYYKTFSLIWLFLGSALYFIDCKSLQKWYYYFILAFIVLIAISINFLTKHKIKHRIKSIDVDIEIVRNDILAITRGSIIIPANDVFDTELGDIISIESIQGQFTQKIYQGNVQRLNSEIASKLIQYEKFAIHDEEKTYGKKKRYPIGTIIDIGTTPRYLLTVVAKMENINKKTQKVTTDELWQILSNIWEFNRSKNSISEIVVPIIGTGMGRISSNVLTVIKMTILSFYQKSKEEKITTKLILVVKKDKIDRATLFEIQDFLKTLS